MDTNNGRPFRFATALIYLNDPGAACGGETVFPLAFSEDACGAEALFQEGHAHTGEGASEATAKLLALGREACAGRRGLAGRGAVFTMERPRRASRGCLPRGTASKCPEQAVAPERGLLILFYSRERGGAIDAASWHGGCAVDPASPGKWTCQKFFEVPRKYALSVVI